VVLDFSMILYVIVVFVFVVVVCLFSMDHCCGSSLSVFFLGYSGRVMYINSSNDAGIARPLLQCICFTWLV